MRHAALASLLLFVSTARAADIGGYNVANSVEFGYRFAEVDGNRGQYRANVNYLNGVRLLGSSFSAHSRNGQGRWFDEFLLTTQGLGADPYQFANLRFQKNRIFRYDFLWRLNDYYNPALTVSEGRHFRNTTRRWQDHDLILLPQSKFQLRLGYTGNRDDGPALSTVQLFDSRGDEFTPFADIRRSFNAYRVGSDIEISGFRFSWLRSWENFKEDTPYLLGASPGAAPEDLTTLNNFRREEPYHGNSPLWRGNLHGERRYWSINARMTYVGARRNFVLSESALGTFRTAINREILTAGTATRPTAAGDFLISLFPAEKVTIVNNTSYYNSRINGDSFYREVNNSVASGDLVNFQFLGIRTVTNATDVNYRPSAALGFFGGYHYSTRVIRSTESRAPGGRIEARQENGIHSGLGGLRLRPAPPLTIALDAEIARADRPFTPIAERNFHAFRAQTRYRARSLALTAAYRQNYNTNSVAISTHSARARTYSFDGSWTPRGWFSLDAGYSKLHLDTVSGIAFFAGGNFFRGQNSVYISNIHAANLGVRFGLGRRADLFAGYTLSKDRGDGRSVPVPPSVDAFSSLLLPFQTFPLTFQSPQARLSIRIAQNIRWNTHWQFFNYDEKFQLWIAPQNYRAHTGYTSLLWSF
jgi:hypothetical protein